MLSFLYGPTHICTHTWLLERPLLWLYTTECELLFCFCCAFTCLLRNLYGGQETTVRTRYGTTDWFQIEKVKYVKAVYCHFAYLTYMKSTSWETLGWKKHKLESRLSGKISITSDMQMTPPFCQKVKRNKKPLDESERREWKSWLKSQHSEN